MLGADPEAASSRAVPRPLLSAKADRIVELSLHHDLASIENDWRAFEERADCTVFQTFDWLSTWLRNIGVHEGAKPAIVIGRHGGAILFLLPFALEADGFVRKITWLGSCLCNYNGPAGGDAIFRGASARAQFAEIWREIQRLLRQQLGHDLDRPGENAEDHRRAGQSVLRARASRRTSTMPI